MFESDFVIVFGGEKFRDFSKFMHGQTTAQLVNPFTGKEETFYYSVDIYQFKGRFKYNGVVKVENWEIAAENYNI